MLTRKNQESIVLRAANILEKIEEGVSTYLSEQTIFKLRLIRLIQRFAKSNWIENSFPRKHLSEHFLDYLQQALSFFEKVIWLIEKHETNYFGTFDENILKIDSNLMIEFFISLVDSLDSPISSLYSPYRYLLASTEYLRETTLKTGSSSPATPSSPSIAKIPFTSQQEEIYHYFNESFHCLHTKLFWIKHFTYKSFISWNIFLESFQHFYSFYANDQIKSNNFQNFYKRFHQYLFFPHYNELTKNDEELQYIDLNSSQSFDFNVLDEFCMNYFSLFQAFQEKCDYGMNLYLSGTILEKVIDYRKPTILRSLIGIQISSIDCGDQHIAIVSSSGHLYTFGKGCYGRLGHGNENDLSTPTLVSTLIDVPIMKVSCGYAYTFALTREGKLFSWGAGGNGRLGLGNDTNTFLPMMVRSMKDEIVKNVCTGGVHTAMLTTDGRVFTCGKGSYTGHGERNDCYLPKMIQAFQGIFIEKISIATGGFHTLVLTKGGELYSWGHNRVGQLGLLPEGMERNEDGGYFQSIPKQVIIQDLPSSSRIVDIAAGWGHSACLSDAGQVFVCGRNVEGQLGLNNQYYSLPVNERGHRYQPIFTHLKDGDLKYSRKIQKIWCGGEHTLFYGGGYDLIGTGQSTHGELGHAVSSNESIHSFPSMIPFFQMEKREILQVSCAYHCSLILVGRRNPVSLRRLCSEVIRKHPELFFATEETVVEDKESQQEALPVPPPSIVAPSLTVPAALPPSINMTALQPTTSAPSTSSASCMMSQEYHEFLHSLLT